MPGGTSYDKRSTRDLEDQAACTPQQDDTDQHLELDFEATKVMSMKT